jgi:hypothetical protein
MRRPVRPASALGCVGGDVHRDGIPTAAVRPEAPPRRLPLSSDLKDKSRSSVLTPVLRAFAARSARFPDQTLLETIAGQRTSVGAEKPLANRSGRLSSILFPSTAGPTTGCNFFFLQTWRKIYVQTFPSTAGP